MSAPKFAPNGRTSGSRGLAHRHTETNHRQEVRDVHRNQRRGYDEPPGLEDRPGLGRRCRSWRGFVHVFIVGVPVVSGASAIKCCYGGRCGQVVQVRKRPGLQAPVSRKTSIRAHKGIVVAKKMSRKVSRRMVRPACIAGVRNLTSELQSSVRSDEVVIATEQLQVLIEPLRRASVGKRSSRKVC